MLRDEQYQNIEYKVSEIKHLYGENVHILSDPYLFTTLARLGSTECRQPEINQLLNTLYRDLVKVAINREFPTLDSTIRTRMAVYHPDAATFVAPIIDPKTRVVSVNLARAGTVPSQICFDAFNYILDPEGVRQDHISINRKVDTDEKVVGTNLGGVKIGGDVKESIVVFPDPMGATGSTIQAAMEIYRKLGKARKFIALHLIITPEYLTLIQKEFPELVVYAIRLDRGLSSAAVLATVPGTRRKEERGLNDRHYIVPGAGGLGEVINNSFV
jgi:uracil phosphoribosyltransferase